MSRFLNYRLKSAIEFFILRQPLKSTKLEIVKHSMEKLTNAVYVYIRMDHFVRPDEKTEHFSQLI